MNYEQPRINMVKQQLQTFDVFDEALLDQANRIPREWFVPEPFKALAYSDCAIPLEHGQIILPPKEEARIIQSLHLQPTDRVLEIGTGSGYSTALYASLTRHVDSVDIFPEFTANARKVLDKLSLKNITLATADASQGYNLHTLYDVIVISAALPEMPQFALSQLLKGGRLFVFLGKSPAIQATVLTHTPLVESFEKNILFETTVPSLLGAPKSETFRF